MSDIFVGTNSQIPNRHHVHRKGHTGNLCCKFGDLNPKTCDTASTQLTKFNFKNSEKIYDLMPTTSAIFVNANGPMQNRLYI